MPNTSVQAAAEGVLNQHMEIADLENPIEDSRRMASIVSRMVTDMVGGSRCRYPGRDDLYLLTEQQCEDLVWAAYHAEDMIAKVRERWGSIVDRQTEVTSTKVDFQSVASAPAAVNPDPLLDVIRAYQRGYDDFNLNAPKTNDDAAVSAYVDASYGPHFKRLQEWEGPAGSMDGAIEALRIALSDDRGVQGSDAEERMVAAALAYLESGAAMTVDETKLLNAEDLVYEGANLTQLVANTVENTAMDEDTQAMIAGLSVIR